MSDSSSQQQSPPSLNWSKLDCGNNLAQIEERFMVDMKTYEHMHEKEPDVVIEEHSRLDPWPMTISKTKDLSAKDFMLLPNSIFGFKLKAKKWSEHDFFPSHKWHEVTIRIGCLS